MIRTDSAGGTLGFLDWLTAKGRNFSYSVGFPIHGAVAAALPLVPTDAWTKAYDSEGVERDGAWVTDITGMLELSSWPAGMRVIVRKEIPHAGPASVTDIDGHRYTAMATNREKGKPRWRSATGFAPAAKTGSPTPKTPAWPTCPSTPLLAMKFGATWSCSPLRSWPGPK